MSYISAYKPKSVDSVIVWERSENGREVKTFDAPYYFYVRDDKGDYTSMYGDKLSRVDFTTSSEFYAAKTKCKDARLEMFESDIPVEIKVLSKNYYNVPAPKLHVTFFDIEVDYSTELGFSSVDNPYAPINSIALYHYWSKQMVVLAIPPPEFKERDDQVIKQLMGEVCPLPTGVDVEIRLFGTEKQLLMEFCREIDDSDVISGWNSDFFDVPYIGRRLEKYGKRALKLLSFPEGDIPKWRDVETEFRKNTALDLSGRIRADYMDLFRKYEMEQRPSYSLMNIADEILPHLPKLHYEGSLAGLYRKNFPYFIRYNLRDTEILKGFEDRLGYMELANQMYHLSTGVFMHVSGTLKLAEMSVVNTCHHELGGLIVNDVKEPDIDRQIKGALVLYPQVGEHEMTGSIDVGGLYPSSIESINISPETLRGQFLEDFAASEDIAKGNDVYLTLILEDGSPDICLTAKQWRQFLRDRKWAVSGYGTVFDQTKKGIIPSILAEWKKKRKYHQKLKAEAKKAGDKIKETYHDKQQYTYKIKLNSFYGALSNLYFRFYDIRMGESTTATGRAVLKHQCRKTSELLGCGYNVDFPQYLTEADAIKAGADPKTALHGPVFQGKFQSEAVLYGDTDSTYFHTYAATKEEAIIFADAIGKAVNDSYQQFMRETFLCNPGYDDLIKANREIVSDRGIFVDKKRYILHLIDLDKNPVDKMKVMGLDTKKTTLPRWVSAQLNNYIERYLKGDQWTIIEKDIVDFKDKLTETSDIMSIGLPKGIKGLEEYTQALKLDKTTRVPGHVMAAIHYNQCLAKFQDKESLPIMSNMKIKVFYITVTDGRFKSIAIPVDIEQVPKWFAENFVVNREMHVERLVDNPLQNIIKAIGKTVPSRHSLRFDSLFGD